jgi:DNA excision repair protein ERCC-2
VAIRVDLDTQTLTAPVGELVRVGSGRNIGLAGGGLARLWMGVKGHQRIQAQRVEEVPGYQPERPVGGRLELDGWTLELTGRADGVVLDEDDRTVEVEEIKTVHLGRDLFGPVQPERMDQHRHQIQLYARLLSGDGPPVPAYLTLVDVIDGRVLRQEVTWSKRSVDAWLRRKIHMLAGQEIARREHAQACAEAAEVLPFPHDEVRPVQQPMIDAVRDGLVGDRHLLVAAPTGVGKTAAALYPAVREALARGNRVVFLTAKTLQQELAVKTTRGMQREGSPWRSLQLRAKSAMCANDEMVCHEDVCPYAENYAAKLAESSLVDQLLETSAHLDPDTIFDAGRLRLICPFELQLDLLDHADVVVCDYNYVFDPRIGLDSVAGPGTLERSVLVVDEAHNLVDRAREYYSPTLSLERVEAALEQLATQNTRLFVQIRDAIEELREYVLYTLDEAFAGAQGQQGTSIGEFDPEPLARARRELDPLLVHYVQFKREHRIWNTDDPVMALYFQVSWFHRVLKLGGDEFVHLAIRTHDGDQLRILCLDAARFVGQVLEGSAGVVAMSATLEPFEFYRDLLGFDPSGTDTLTLPSPFPPENRLLIVDDSVDTTYRQRQRHYGRIARLVADCAPRGRNTLALFPSYRFLDEIAYRIDAPHHHVEVQRANDRLQHREVLESLSRGQPTLLLAVLGGVFAEGVDYPGDMLSAVFVVSPGLPQLEPERELLKRHFEEAYGDGFGYAYLIPGLRRVVQAAGRLIRSEDDRGAIVLVGRRFLQPRYAALLPREWTDGDVRQLRARDPRLEIDRFFVNDL